jgi:AcrR family transcriptional regulator
LSIANITGVPAKDIAHARKRGYASAARAEQARQTRKRVIEAATRLFVQQGYATTTIRAIAAAAHVSVPTVELLFGTKAQLLHVVIDVAVAGDDEPIPVLGRAWAAEAQSARGLSDFLSAVAQVLCEAQARSAGVILAAYEAARADPDIHVLIADRESQRQHTASWIVDGVMARAALRPELDRTAAIDTVWLLMGPVIFSRLIGQRGWSPERYRSCFVDSVTQLLTSERR